MNKKTVLIIGSTGTLGQALISEFTKASYNVVPADKDQIDVTGPDCGEKIHNLKPDIIINATAYNAVDKMENEPEASDIGFAINAEAPGKLAEIAKKLGALFVHYSSNYVFDGEKKDGYSETDKPHPVNKYGESKQKGEAAVQKAGEKYYIIRLARLFGIRGTSETSKRTFVEIMMNEVDKKDLEVGDTEHSSITYASDLAKLTRKIIEEKFEYGIYHGANEGDATWFDWASEIFKDLGKGPKVVPASHSLTPKTTKHPVYSTLINTKLPKQRSWQEALKEFMSDYYK